MERLDIPVTWCQGNFAYCITNPEIRAILDEWSFDAQFTSAPRTLFDAVEESVVDMLVEVHRVADVSFDSRHAYVAEEHVERLEETEDQGPLDFPDEQEAGSTDIPLRARERGDYEEKEMLEEVPMPGTPKDEWARKRAWLRNPRNARIAIRKLHNEWGAQTSISPKGDLTCGERT